MPYARTDGRVKSQLRALGADLKTVMDDLELCIGE
jgi:hypothetical protein